MDTEFYKNNEVRIGEDYKSTQPHYYSSLRNAFKSYFDTFLDVKDNVCFLVDFNWKRDSIGLNFNISYENIVTVILEFQRFFELLIKDILSRVDPFLSVRLESDSKKLVDYHIGDVSHKQFNTVEFREAKNRLKILLNKIEDGSDHSKLKAFKFLVSKDSGLEELNWWRNRLTHNGSNIPNVISLDYLISQKIVPLILLVIKTESDLDSVNKLPYYFETASGIKIIERISQIKFEKNDLIYSEERLNATKIANKYIELYHLKALGRAAINYNKYLQINFSRYTEYHRLRHKDNHKFVKFQEQDENYLKTNNCLCCDNFTMVTYKEVYYHHLEKRELDLLWSQCCVCDYGISNKLGNPKDSNITDKDIFN